MFAAGAVPALRAALRTETYVLLATALLLLILSLFPVAIILRQSLFDASNQLSAANFIRVFGDPSVLHIPLWNSVRVSITITAIALVLAYPLAFLVTRTDMPCRVMIAALTLGPYIIPSYALSMAWVLTFSAGGVGEALVGVEPSVPAYGFWPIAIVSAVHLFPLAFIMLSNAIGSLNPELFEAARIHGAKASQRLFRVTLPMLLPAILSSGMVVFAFAMNEFAPAALLGTSANFYVLTTQIWSFATVYPTNYGVAAVLSLILLAAITAVLQTNRLLLGKRRYTTIGGNLGQSAKLALGRWRYVALGYCVLLLATVLLLPTACILVGSLVDIWGKGWGPANWTLRHFADLLEDRTYKQSIVNVLVLGALTGLCTVLIGSIIGYFIARSGRRVSQLLEIGSSLPLILPGVLVGLALILGFSTPPFDLYGTVWLLLLGYVVRFLPIVVSSCTAAMAQISEQVEEASRIFGASWARTQFQIMLPLLRGPLFGAMILVVISVLKEVGMAAFAWAPGAEVAPVMALMQFTDGFVQQAIGLSFVMLVVALIGAVIAVRLGAIKFVDVR